MIPRKRFDIRWSDLLFGTRACLRMSNSRPVRQRVEEAWSPGYESVACLSVRSGFDALLSVLALPAGSEVLVSAVTIRDMSALISRHGLVPVPVDLDFGTLAIDIAAMAGAVTPQTKAILVAHLFGSRMAIEPIAEFAGQHGLFLIEDCAQAFTGDHYRGATVADVSLFSFGPIKTSTALGGGMLRFRDAELGRLVREHMRQWPQQDNRQFLLRLIKYALLVLLSYRFPYTLFTALLKLLRIDHDRLISRSVRGFAGGDFLRKIRRQPATALLALLERRLNSDSALQVKERRQIGREAVELLPDFEIPGCHLIDHSFWVFPILHPDPDGLVKYLIAQGFDATRGASSMCVVPSPHSFFPAAENAERAFARLLYLPIYPGVTHAELRRMATAIETFNVIVAPQETPVAQEVSLPGEA